MEITYKEPFDVAKFQEHWLSTVRERLIEIEAKLRDAKEEPTIHANTREQAATQLHKVHLMAYFGERETRIRGYNSCYACLMEVPQHPLACGHMLCRACVRMLGNMTDKHTVTIDFCPMEPYKDRQVRPCSIRFKPDFAGIRVLSLDG